MGSPSKGFSVLSGLLSPVSDGWVQTRSTTASFGFMTGGREALWEGTELVQRIIVGSC